MIPIEFDEQNLIIAKDQPPYLPFPVYRVPNDPEGKVIACWELSDEEIDKLVKTKKIYQMILTFNMDLQPQCLQVEKFDLENL